MPNAGKFELKLTDPYPVWCVLMHRGEAIVRFPHTELADLQFIVQRAMVEARQKLPDSDKEEV